MVIRSVVPTSNMRIQRFMVPEFALCSIQTHRPDAETLAKPAIKPKMTVVIMSSTARTP